MKRTEHMSEEQQENVAEELTEWSEIDLSPEDKKEKVLEKKFNVDLSDSEVISTLRGYSREKDGQT